MSAEKAGTLVGSRMFAYRRVMSADAISEASNSPKREDSLPPVSSARPMVPVARDTLPPSDDVERHDTIPAPTWLGEPNESGDNS